VGISRKKKTEGSGEQVRTESTKEPIPSKQPPVQNNAERGRSRKEERREEAYSKTYQKKKQERKKSVLGKARVKTRLLQARSGGKKHGGGKKKRRGLELSKKSPREDERRFFVL